MSGGEIRLVALKIGAGVPAAGFTGKVRSVFPNAAILAIGDKLVTLVPAAAGGLPAAVTVDIPAGFDFTGHVAVGAVVAARGGVLRLAAAGISIDQRTAVPWRSDLGRSPADFGRKATRSAWELVAGVLRTDGRSKAIARLGAAAIVALAGASRSLDVAAAEAAAARLVGLGAGGTPAGDDVLVGYLAGLWSTAGSDARRARFVTEFGARLLGLANRTNAVSRAYLEAAILGEVSEHLAAVAARIAEGAASAAVSEAASSAIAVGHTSGADGVLGLLVGLAAWGPDPIFAASRHLVVAVPRGARNAEGVPRDDRDTPSH